VTAELEPRAAEQEMQRGKVGPERDGAFGESARVGVLPGAECLAALRVQVIDLFFDDAAQCTDASPDIS